MAGKSMSGPITLPVEIEPTAAGTRFIYDASGAPLGGLSAIFEPDEADQIAAALNATQEPPRSPEGDCPATDSGYACTLDAGHSEKHEAWGVTEVLHEWQQQPPAQTEGPSGSAGSCGAVSEDSYACTLDQGHEVDHEAYTNPRNTGKPVKVWPRDTVGEQPTPQGAGKQWTREFPGVSGNYVWFSGTYDAICLILYLVKMHHGTWVAYERDSSCSVHHLEQSKGSKWFGPLEPGEGG